MNQKEVFVNNESKVILDEDTLVDVLKHLGFDDKKGIAIAINNDVILKQDWATTPLSQHDKITIIRATQGG